VKNSSSGLLIALSAGGINSELAAHGIGEEHVEELMVRIAMRLLADGHRLSFGGTMGVAGQPLTEHLIETCQKWLAEESASQVDVTQPTTWPLVNYSAWPNYSKITQEQRARLVGICHFVDVDPVGVTRAQLDTVNDPAAIKRHSANALSAMRERSAKETDLRVVWGGRIQGASGWMAGILEEVAFSLEHHKPVLVLGGFGGCSRLIADFLADENAPWPNDLSLQASTDAERDAELVDEQREALGVRFDKVKKRLTEFRISIWQNDQANGVASKVIRELLLDDNSRSVINTAAVVAGGL